MYKTDIPDLYLSTNFITFNEESILIKQIDQEKWKPNRKGDRKVQIYGPYHDSKYTIIPGKFSEHSIWLQELAKKIWFFTTDPHGEKLMDPKKCEVYINEYNDL